MASTATGPHGFTDIPLPILDALPKGEVDALPYGVVGLSGEGTVEVYNAAEARLAGLDAASILGTHYFAVVAQCMNNFMVAQRFEDEEQLDVVIEYVLTLRMRPTPVRLRLLKSPAFGRRYILIER